MFNRFTVGMLVLVTGAILSGCKPQTTGQKIENKAEDAAHETKQGMERAGEKVKDATN